MIDFELKGASNWWIVTIGGSLDDIQIRIQINHGDPFLTFISLQELLELYEISIFETPTERRGRTYTDRYEIIEKNNDIIVKSLVNDWEATTTYEELRDSLEKLLSEIFNSLDKSSEPTEREEGLEYINTQFKVDVKSLYNRLSNVE